LRSCSNADTIVALATPQGVGAIGVIRLSGSDAVKMRANFQRQKFRGTEIAHGSLWSRNG